MQANTFIRRPKFAGENMECPVCKDRGQIIVLQAQMVNDGSGGQKLSWRNSDGSAHQLPPNFEHVSKKMGGPIPNTNGGNPAAEEKFEEANADTLKLYETELDEIRELRKVAVSLVKERNGQLRGDIVAYETRNLIMLRVKTKLVDLQKSLDQMPTEINRASSIHKLFAKQEGAKGSYHQNALLAGLGKVSRFNTLEDNVKIVISRNPSFFTKKTSINENIEIYLREIYGIELPDIPISLESISRAFRKELDNDMKHYDKELEYREKYGK